MTYVTLVDRCSGSDAQIEGAAEFAQDLERNPLRFAFVDGQIPDLCPEVGESEWVLNIKRSALSAFQNNMDDLHDNTRTREVKELAIMGQWGMPRGDHFCRGLLLKISSSSDDLQMSCRDLTTWHVVKSLQLIWRSALGGEIYGFPNELQRFGIKIGHQGRSFTDGR